MSETSTDTSLPFLKGGGEMGRLTRAKDWSSTPVGLPESWPQSLKTTLSILLNSRFPMFLWWGPELISFYNDAYRPSLGQHGKHPSILGMTAQQAWPEVWETIKPLIDQVLCGGEAVWSENQLIPIFRNGTIEDVYWTSSYSPVEDESGKVAGVLVTCSETTQAIHHLKQLEESQDQLSFAIEATELGTFDYDPRTNRFSANDRLKEWFGLLPRSSIKLDNALNAIVPQDRERVVEAIQTALDYASGGDYNIEYTIVHPATYKETIVKARGRAWFDETKKAYRFNGTLQDVTEQALARKRIEESEKQFRNLVMQSPMAIAIFRGRNLVIELANSRMVQGFWRLEETDVLGKTLMEVFPELKDQKYPELLLQVLESGKIYTESESLAYVQGGDAVRKYYIDFEYAPLLDVNDQVSGVMATVNDVTQRVEARQKLEESEASFRLLADSMPQFVWSSDEEGNLNYFNQSVYQYSGLGPDQIKQSGWLQIVHPDDKEANLRTWLHAIRTGHDFLFEHRFRHHNGSYRWQLSRAVPLKDTEGRIQMWVGTSTDIHDQKEFTTELEKLVQERTGELKQKNADLEKMNKELQAFTYISSHDLQEPLRKIQTFASRIVTKEYQNLSETGKEYFNRMNDSARRMQLLIDDLLAYSRTTASERKFEDISLAHLLEAVQSDLNEEIRAKNAVIETGQLCTVKIIPFQFHQLFSNLISNSLKFSRPDIPPRIGIACALVAGHSCQNLPLDPAINYHHIRFIDNGIGFDQKYGERIFEVFQRLNGKNEYSGTGIGLAIVKKIVENHDGFIQATGRINAGATFDLYIPQA